MKDFSFKVEIVLFTFRLLMNGARIVQIAGREMSAGSTVGGIFPKEMRDESSARDAITPMLMELLNGIERSARQLMIIEERRRYLRKEMFDLFALSKPLFRRSMDQRQTRRRPPRGRRGPSSQVSILDHFAEIRKMVARAPNLQK